MSYVHPEFLISAEDLAEQISDPSLRVFDTSVVLHHSDGGYRSEPGHADYLKHHIAGAGFINLSDSQNMWTLYNVVSKQYNTKQSLTAFESRFLILF